MGLSVYKALQYMKSSAKFLYPYGPYDLYIDSVPVEYS